MNTKRISLPNTPNASAPIHDSRIGFSDKLSAKKPVVLMVGMHLSKTRGGITTLINEILNSEFSSEFDVRYIASQAEDLGTFGKGFLAVGSIARFCLKLLLDRPNLVYVHIGSNASLYRESFFIYLAKLFRLKVVSHFHAGDIDNYFPNQPRLGQSFIKRAIELSDSIIAVSNESARQLEKYASVSNLFVVPNAIDTKLFETERNEKSAKPVKLLFVGAIGKLKGESDLLKALGILKKEGLDFRISILGYGAENLDSFCKTEEIFENVDFLGPVSLNERVSYFKEADVFVLPTYAEAMPMSVIEAMAAGMAIVSTNVGGIPEMIDDGIDGFLVSPGNVAQLSEKISTVVRDAELRQTFGSRARKKAKESFDFKSYVERIRGILR